MRSTVFSLLFTIMLLLPRPALASENTRIAEPPRIAGEDFFNDTVGEIAEGGFSLSPVRLINELGRRLTNEIRMSAKYVIAILLIAALAGLVRVLSDSFGKGTAEAAGFVCFALMSTAALGCFTLALSYVSNVTGAVCSFITKLTPALIMTLYACGSTASAAAFEPVLSAAVYVISLAVEKCLVPMICFSAVLSVAGNINDKVQISNFCRVLKSIAKWIMAAAITVFTAVCAAYGMSAPSLDAVGGKAVKFAVGSLVPVVGGFLSDTLSTVMSGAKLIKNAVGVAGMTAICVICLVPALKIFVMQLILKIGAALSEPIAEKRVSDMLWDISDSVMTLFAAAVMIMVLFIINIGIILAATGF